MDEIKDPLLADKEISTGGYETQFSSITKKNLKIVGGYLQIIWRVKAMKGKSVPIDDVIENTRIIFTDSIIRTRDTLWIQHCASSLRELVADLQIPEDFLSALKCLPSREQGDGSPTPEYVRIRNFEEFLNSVTHFSDGSTLQKAKDITGNNQLREINDEIFEKICTQFMQELYNLFSSHCMKDKRPAQ